MAAAVTKAAYAIRDNAHAILFTLAEARTQHWDIYGVIYTVLVYLKNSFITRQYSYLSQLPR